jgi:DNA-binding NtrC family response regulator
VDQNVTGVSDKKIRFLVLDDDRKFANFLVEYLRSMGYPAEAAYGGVEGIERFKSGNFHMVITDMEMPDMSGMEILDAVKSIDKNTVVIMTTSQPTIDGAAKAINAGAYDCLSKPIDFESMEAIIEQAVERHTPSEQRGKLREVFKKIKPFGP